MVSTDQFNSALARLCVSELAAGGMLPTLLAQVCVEVMGVDGASISLMNDTVRMPLGADSPTSAVAEKLQFSLGEGPCLESYRTGLARAFTHDETVARWPEYARRLSDEATYCSCAGLPLDLGPGLVGALDLYLAGPLSLTDTAMTAASAVAVEVTRVLLADLSNAGPELEPDWLSNESMRSRANLWVAIGMILPTTSNTAAEITELIRSYASSHDQRFDDITEALVERTLHPDELFAVTSGP
jgi:hypothetical protein